ncbi:adenylosuccinate synthetase [Nitrosospira multiformis]|uniref:adenylosuccinate synthetase n=1 Tax=Nitrosospira multiformis TaxID=1231 RepID=UPI00089C3FB6|nr:adenylosuccinate synthetase [Nitrosospira multiformis]SEA18478.1 adenylosuccinate synthase [Nitrosospira multiformis]
MPITIIVGGQYGSEGKGKVSHALAKEMGASVAIRIGGPNSGHTVISPSGESIIFKHLPTAAILPDVTCILGAGSYINPDILLAEIKVAGLSESRLIIDPNAAVITDAEIAEEQGSRLREEIGSTLSGTGAAVIKRIQRDGALKLAKNDDRLAPYVQPSISFMRSKLDKRERVIIEGTQGYGLSLLHSPHYPFVTSRDTTAAGFLSEVGLGPRDVDDVVLVLRTFPIRVSGNSGPLSDEIDWNKVTSEAGSESQFIEFTSVTRTVRRIGRFDVKIVRHAIAANNPSRIVLNHLDYVDRNCAVLKSLTNSTTQFVQEVEANLGRAVDYYGFGQDLLINRQGNEIKMAKKWH